MCDIDYDERNDVWTEHHRTARKEHRCDGCEGIIRPGERYLIHFSIWEGELTRDKCCAACEADRDVFAKAHEGVLCVPSGFQDELWRCINESDEEDEDHARWEALIDGMRKRKQATVEGGR